MATEIRQASGPWMYRRTLRLLLNYVVAIAIGIVMIFPLLWMFRAPSRQRKCCSKRP